MLTTRAAIALKIESTYKTDATPDPAVDAILVSQLNESNSNLRMIERNNIKPSLATDQQVFGGTMKQITFTAEVKGSGTAGQPPDIGQALRACGLSETIVPSTSVTYQPASTALESATIYYYMDGILKRITGARGTASFTGETGSYGMINFEFIGHDDGEADLAYPTLSYDSTVPVPLINLNFSVDSYGAIINSLNLDLANTMSIAPNIRETYGFGEVRITKRDVNGTMDPESVTLSTQNFISAFRANTVMPLDTGVIGATEGNRYQITSNIAIRDISNGEREQIMTNELTFACIESTSDDEIVLEFT
jgi:hypothetical protein